MIVFVFVCIREIFYSIHVYNFTQVKVPGYEMRLRLPQSFRLFLPTVVTTQYKTKRGATKKEINKSRQKVVGDGVCVS